MDEVGYTRDGNRYTDAQFEMLMKDKAAARASRLGLIAMLGIAVILATAITVIVLAVNGVWS